MTTTTDGFYPQPVTITGAHVLLEPLGIHHAADLHAAGADPEIWRYLPIPPPATLYDTQAWIHAAVTAGVKGEEVPFAIIHRATRQAIGSTRFIDIRREHRGLEIGWTWLDPRHHRTPANTETKYLLLRHAFEDLGAVRVQLKTDLRNERSQRAIERIGAIREGVLRRHIVLWDGYVRDTVYYSIVDCEWPAVRERLEKMLDWH